MAELDHRPARMSTPQGEPVSMSAEVLDRQTKLFSD
jgi:hypothetical protein